VAVQLFVLGLYLPPVFLKNGEPKASPPQTIISLFVHTAVCTARASGALVVLVAIQVSVLGLYFPPVFKKLKLLPSPPQTIISLPVHTAVCHSRASAALVVLVASQLFVAGLYLPPVFKWPVLYPPQTIISVPVHTTV
jgi:hypothetical protein